MKKIFSLFVFLSLAAPYAGAQRKERRCGTCGKTVATCPYKGRHPSRKTDAAPAGKNTAAARPAKTKENAVYTMSAEGRDMLHRLAGMPFGTVQTPTPYTTLRDVEQAVEKTYGLKPYKMACGKNDVTLSDTLLIMAHYKGLYPDGDAFPLTWEGHAVNASADIDADGCLLSYDYDILETTRAQALAIARELGADTPIEKMPDDMQRMLNGGITCWPGNYENGIYFYREGAAEWIPVVKWSTTFNSVSITILHKSHFNHPYYFTAYNGRSVWALPENDAQALHSLVNMPFGMERRPKRGDNMGYVDNKSPYFVRSTPQQYGAQITYMTTIRKEGFCLPNFRPPFCENVKTSAFKLFEGMYKLCAYGYEMEGLTPEQERFIISELEMQNTSPQTVYVPENDTLNQLFARGVDPTHPEWAYVHVHGKKKVFLLLHKPTGTGSTQRRDATLWIWLDK